MKQALENKILESFKVGCMNRWKPYNGLLENKLWNSSLLYQDIVTGAIMERDNVSGDCILSGVPLSKVLCETFTNLLDMKRRFIQSMAEADLCDLYGVSDFAD